MTSVRNFLYDIEHKKSFQFDVLTIGVGNLRVGGTGKTPVSEFILKYLKSQNTKASYLSRGYGRKSKGFLQVELLDTSNKVGDEALQIKQNFPDFPVAVCEERIIGIPFIIVENPGLEAIVLDDIYQHRSVRPHLNILLTAYDDLFVDDFVLPMGMLRESRKGANRADLVIVTKCPAFSSFFKPTISEKITPYINKDVPILFSTIDYLEEELVLGTTKKIDNCTLLSAIANNEQFGQTMSSKFKVQKHYKFSDHHEFSQDQIKEIVNFNVQNNIYTILTTAKDWQRLKKHADLFTKHQLNVLVAPISIVLDQPQILYQKIADAQKNI